MFAGTSAGSIVALALACGGEPDDIIKMWEQQVAVVFQESWSSRITTLDNFIGAAYGTDDLKKMLEGQLGNRKLRDLEKKMLVPSFNLDPTRKNVPTEYTVIGNSGDATTTNSHLTNAMPSDHSKRTRWQPEFFHNFSNSPNLDESLVDICLRSAAAPTYFPINDGYVDGGTYANNPSMAAIATALAGGVKLEDIVVFSISTGSNPKVIPKSAYGNGNWGMYEWAPHIIQLLLDSNTESINYQCRCFLAHRYFRLDPLLPSEIGLDDPSAIPALEKLANDLDLCHTVAWLKEYWFENKEDDDIEELIHIARSSHQDNDNNNPNNSWRCTIQ